MTKELERTLHNFGIQLARMQQGFPLESRTMRIAAIDAGIELLRADFENVCQAMKNEADQ